MLLRRLVIENFGLYRGVQDMDLTPRHEHGSNRPVVLIGGKNGAGKSTIFEAILLCLYGKAVLGGRARQREYLDYLYHRIHRSSSGLSGTRASITLEFDFVLAGVRHVYAVTRSWMARDHTSASIDVTLDLRRDGNRLDSVDQSQWDHFLEELIPLGVSQLFFFDGERIQRLAEQDPRELGRTVKSLLNLHLVERLNADLQIYLTKQARVSAGDSDRLEIDTLEDSRRTAAALVLQLQRERDEHQSSQLDHLASTITELQRKLQAEGSELANMRDTLLAERGRLMLAVERDEERLRELSARTLPFALCPSLLDALQHSLRSGRDHLPPSGRKIVTSRLTSVLERFVAGVLEGSTRMRRGTREKAAAILSRELSAVLSESGAASPVEPIDHLSMSEVNQLATWIDHALRDAAPEATRIATRLETATRRLQRITATLAQAPTEDSLKPIIKAINDAHKDLGAAEREAASLDDRLNGARRQLADIDRRIFRLSGRLAAHEETKERTAMVKRAQAALQRYLVAVTELKLRKLESEVTECFGAICRKDALVRRIRIDPRSFEVALFDYDGHTLPKEALSAGEKQVLAVALLWALSRTSGRPLPVIIDTPLARLDADHRRLLVERYLPSASHQVVLLSTDTEVDKRTLGALEPALSHAYHLRYDDSAQATAVGMGYFWSQHDDSPTSAGQVLHGSR